MSHDEQMYQYNHYMSKKLIPKLIVNLLVPLLAYMLLRNIFSNDTTALATAGAIPAVCTIVLWLWHRQVNWIGIIAILGLSIAIAVSALYGGSSLPLKIYHPIIAGAVGFIFLISVVIRKPLMIVLLKKFKVGDSERFSNPVVYRKVTIVTSVFGSILLLDTVIHIILALTISTGTYLIISRIIMIVIAAILFFASKWVMRHSS